MNAFQICLKITISSRSYVFRVHMQIDLSALTQHAQMNHHFGILRIGFLFPGPSNCACKKAPTAKLICI